MAIRRGLRVAIQRIDYRASGTFGEVVQGDWATEDFGDPLFELRSRKLVTFGDAQQVVNLLVGCRFILTVSTTVSVRRGLRPIGTGGCSVAARETIGGVAIGDGVVTLMPLDLLVESLLGQVVVLADAFHDCFGIVEWGCDLTFDVEREASGVEIFRQFSRQADVNSDHGEVSLGLGG